MSVTPTPPEPGTRSGLRTLRFGHSPDADDAYMFYGFHAGLAGIPGCRVEHVLQDIQTLNRRALEHADLEITAVSAHAYAFLAERYAVMSCGASMGIGYGPILVAREARPPLWMAAALVGVFAVFHGHAHGTELPAGQSGLLYSIGFVVATGCLHGVGIGISLVHRWGWGRVALRVAGAAVTVAGFAFLWRALA